MKNVELTYLVIQAELTAANVTAAGLTAENMQCAALGHSMANDLSAYLSLLDNISPEQIRNRLEESDVKDRWSEYESKKE